MEDLHALGVCLYYDAENIRAFDTLVLNPSWISYGVYRLINWGMNNKKHVLSILDFDSIFSKNDAIRYPNEKVNFLFQLMNIYQLAFPINEQMIFVPLLLPADRPKPELIPYFPFGERLRMEYRAEHSLPPNTVARLAVRHSDELNQNSSWRFGALLEWENTKALVEEDRRCRSITVSVMGSKKTEYISRLRESLDNIFNAYKSNRPELKYEVILSDERLNYIDKQLLSTSDVNKFLQSEEQIIGNANARQKLVIGYSNLPLVNPEPTVKAYNLIINNRKLNVMQPESDVTIGNIFSNTHSQNINIYFKNCSIDLQADMNSLAREFRKNGYIEYAEELMEITSDLDKMTKVIPTDIKEGTIEMEEVRNTLKKNGLLNRLEMLYKELCDENSKFYKKVVEIYRGIETLNKLIFHYNNMAQWLGLGLPLIPKTSIEKYKMDGGETNAQH